jgi:hypothetical protein
MLPTIFILRKIFKDQNDYIFYSVWPTRIIILDLITLSLKTIFIQLDGNKKYKNNLI